MHQDLFTPLSLGGLTLPNRVTMAPMTRMRAAPDGSPTPLMAEYYAQRAGAGLIITEATAISPQGVGYGRTPGVFTPAQTAGWRRVTDAVHAAGGRIALQLWHVGRVSDPRFQPGGGAPVAPSAVKPARTYVYDVAPDGGLEKIPVGTPRALDRAELPGILDDYRKAAANAMSAGFDAVEVHAANGYLLDQFLRENSNRRDDDYGGSRENRARFPLEAIAAVAREVGASRTGARISPFITFKDMSAENAGPEFIRLAERLDSLGLAYLHLSEADWDDAPETPASFRLALRKAFRGAIMCAGQYDEAKVDKVLGAGLADLVAFGRPFIANPDLPRRLRDGIPLADFAPEKLFGGDAAGYTDQRPANR